MRIDDQVSEWIAAFLAQEISEEDSRALAAWRVEREENEAYFQKMEKLWQLSADVRPEEIPTDKKVAWENIAAATGMKNDSAARVRDLRWMQRAAAIVLLAISIAAVWWMAGTKEEKIIVRSEGESPMEIMLPDSSIVWLNSQTEIAYDKSFPNRIVHLTGEAFFEVKKADGKKFEIFHGEAKVMVLGTSFNVRAYPGEETVEVTVETGKVALSDAEEAERIILPAGTSGSYHKPDNRLEVVEGKNENADAWKQQRLVFSNTPMSDVIRSLERYFNKRIILENSRIKKCRFSGDFENPKLSDLLQAIAFAMDLKVNISGGAVILTGEGCKPGTED